MPTSPAGDRDQPPLLADRYELGTILGRGGMADVYRALDRLLDRQVAVKMLREPTAEGSDRARFIDEARTLAGLSHSGLVTVLDAGFGRNIREAVPDGQSPNAVVDRPYLVMELVDGPSLAQAIAQGPLPAEEVGSVGVQVARALAYVHEHNVVHRDIKPGNVLLGSDRVKLADFGIARLLGDSARHTRTGHAIGTAAYLAPEQVTDQPISGATDVYSLGLVLLEALTGQREYAGSAAEAAFARLHRPPRFPEWLPDLWRQLLAAMTALDPVQRPSAQDVADRLLDQPTAPIPLPTHDTADPATSPLLATGTPATRTEPPPQRTSWIDRAGDALASQPRLLADRFRALTPSQRGVFAALAALVLMLVVVALVDDGDAGASGIPDNTPTELREPLQRLHDAVHGGTG